MIGIYDDSLLDLLKQSVGDPIKVTRKQIICRCPWCEMNKDKDHYHLYISLESPIFNCFHCPDNSKNKGLINKLIKKLYGSDISETYVDKSKVNEYINKRITLQHENINNPIKIRLPPLNPQLYPKKVAYLYSRLKYYNIPLDNIHGLVFDIQEFINTNPVTVDDKLYRLQPFLHEKFIGFITKNNSTMILRNIDKTSGFRYYKLKIFDHPFLDYYKICGINNNSKNVILAEGIFDIYSEYLFDYLDMKSDVLLYATVNSKKYHTLIKSIVFNELIFRPDIHILSDKGIKLDDYRKLVYFNRHIINSLSVYYNKTGKDFNDTPCIIEKVLIK